MNHTTFNDPIRTLRCSQFGEDLAEIAWATTSRETMKAPIFDWHCDDQSSTGAPASNVFHEAMRRGDVVFPFDRLRLHVTLWRGDEPRSIRYWIVQHRSFLSAVAYSVNAHFKDIFDCIWFNGENEAYEHMRVIDGETCDLDWMEQRSTDPDWINQQLQGMFHARWGLLLGFYSEYSSPLNFLASVTSARSRRTVAWRESSDHYVLLTPNHPANKRNVAAGSQVDHPDGEHPPLSAHWRRAHWRELRDPRFTQKRGVRVPVRQAWVGPDEWKQGTSIYRMVRPGVPAAVSI